MTVDCPGIVPSVDGSTCLSCGRGLATYRDVVQHKRGMRLPLEPGEVRQLRPKRLSRAEVIAMLPDRISALEGVVAEQVAATEALGERVAELAAQVDRFLDRQPLVLEVRAQHGRQADGGAGGRQEHRRVARDLRRVAGG